MSIYFNIIYYFIYYIIIIPLIQYLHIAYTFHRVIFIFPVYVSRSIEIIIFPKKEDHWSNKSKFIQHRYIIAGLFGWIILYDTEFPFDFGVHYFQCLIKSASLNFTRKQKKIF